MKIVRSRRKNLGDFYRVVAIVELIGLFTSHLFDICAKQVGAGGGDGENRVSNSSFLLHESSSLSDRVIQLI